MRKANLNDGVCEECGNTGLAGEKCLACGGEIIPLSADEGTEKTGIERYPREVLSKMADLEEDDQTF